MKEIKFRAWNRVHQFMMEWDDFLDYEADQMAIVGNDYRIFNDDEFELLQYTGFKDRNGKEVYEGDLIKVRMFFHNLVTWNCDIRNESDEGFAYYKVIFDERQLSFICELVSFTKFKPKNKFTTLHLGKMSIGNIYENPELLGEA